MSRADKTLARMEQNPQGWRYEEVASVLTAIGFSVRAGAGSHRQWTHAKAMPVTVVQKGYGTVPAYQVRQAAAVIRQSRR